jgi:hypothetical protein
MTIRLNPRWLLVSVLLFSLPFCRAQEIQVPPTLTFALGSDAPTDNKLWDLTGNYDFNLTVVDHNGLSLPVLISFNLIQDAQGRLTTTPGNLSGLVFNDDNNSSFAVFTAVRGKVTGSGGLARVHLSIRFAGGGSFGGVQNLIVRGSMNIDAEVDASTGELVSTKVTHFAANIGGINRVKGTARDFTASLPGGVDGTWNLTVNLAGLRHLTGTGVIGLPNDTFGLSLNGKYNGLFRIAAKGAAGVPNASSSGKGSKARILITPDFATVQVNGKLLGQKVSLNVTTDDSAPAE